MINEYSTRQFRSLVSGLSISVACASIFASLFTYDYLIDAINLSGAFLVYSRTSVALLALVALFLPETKDITEVEIQELFRGKSSEVAKPGRSVERDLV